MFTDGRIVCSSAQVSAHDAYVWRTISIQHNKRFAPKRSVCVCVRVYIYIYVYFWHTRASSFLTNNEQKKKIYIYMGVDLNSFIRDPSISPKKNYFSQNFAFLRFIFRRSMLYLCVPCMLCFVHVNGFFFTGKHEETSLFVSMCLLLNC